MLITISMLYTTKLHINITYIKFHQVEHYIHDFILYTRNFLHERENKYCIMGSINQINNENEKYILHFIFHTNIPHIKFSWIHAMKKYQRTYQLVKRQETSYIIIHQEKYIQVYIDYLIE